MSLDNLNLATCDPDSMHARIAELPQQCEDAWRLVEAFRLPDSYKHAGKVVILGMGGSAIGGDLARTLVESSATVPIMVVREYTIPAYVDDSTLVIASSYSGNTEETLSALDQALAKGAKCVCVGTGGKIEQKARAAGLPFLKFSYSSSPRAAIGYSLICLVGILIEAGVASIPYADLQEAMAEMRAWQADLRPDVPEEHNAAKQLARRLYGHIPVVYGSGLLSEIARRIKGQFNENSKSWGFYEIMPELNHNAVLGYTNPEELRQRLFVLALRSDYDHRRVGIRFDVTGDLLSKAGVALETVRARGKSRMAQMLSVVHFGDYVSLYLAYLYGTDPSPVAAISYLKEQLAKA
ncbi:MAG: bifunctional phosphoglucose/phosphomannose isomerase [Anaerolineae bacterium]